MRWRGRQASGNVSDRRGRGGQLAIGGGLGGIVILLITLFLGGDPAEMINVATQSQSAPTSAEEDELAQFAGVVLQDTEDVWNTLFEENFNADYPEPTLVLFSQSDRSGCGFASAATGPFYC